MDIQLLRAFLLVVEHGSLNRAAERLQLAQSTLTRQIRTLEHELGGPLLERSPSGVAPTAAGQLLERQLRPVLADLDRALGEVRKRARGQSAELRIGYLMSAVADYLNPALATLRRAHPEVKVRMLDLSPGEQMAALRRGEIDVALIGATGRLLSREFYVRRLARLPVLVALAEQHPLAARKTLHFADLRGEHFVGAPETDVPCQNGWISRLARRSGFRARFVQDADSLTHGLLLVVTEGAVSLIPEYAAGVRVPGVVFRPLKDAAVHWDLLVAWQRGKVSAPVRALLDALPAG